MPEFPSERARPPAGYLVSPAGPEDRPVLVLHAWWGLNDTARAFCDRLAAAGFTVFAPDLYHGGLADTVDGAEALAEALDETRARSDTAAAARFLAGKTGRALAVVGFSLGAFYALDLSASEPGMVDSVVLYYGTGPADFSRARADYLGHFAGDDPYEPAEYVDWLENALQEAGRRAAFHRYPGTGHWFCEPDRPGAFDPAAAELAWERTLAFLLRNQ